ncbi:unnamed protein product [Rotaria sordida]|uniref:Uncharacterized protein n=2 Tax=Rotaria sordida TaxID=392033 RepID=A0A815J1K4_9BILA|nr:unnamed protein product [Rotaria sordida]CAF3764427.1 unnamed protein product [Rotaria sordida]
MDSTNIIIPFDFPFAILEYRNNPDPNNKLVYAIADGQYTYGPLSLFQYHNDEKYSKTIRNEELPASLPCKEFYIVESGFSIDNAIEINDNNRGQIYVKEVDDESQQIQMKGLIQEMIECKNELRSLKSIVLSEDRITRRSSSNINNCSLNTSYKSVNDDVLTPLRNKKQIQSTIVQRSISTIAARKNLHTPPRSQSVTTTRILLKNVRSSGYGQQYQSPSTKRQLSTFTTPERSFHK